MKKVLLALTAVIAVGASQRSMAAPEAIERGAQAMIESQAGAKVLGRVIETTGRLTGAEVVAQLAALEKAGTVSAATGANLRAAMVTLGNEVALGHDKNIVANQMFLRPDGTPKLASDSFAVVADAGSSAKKMAFAPKVTAAKVSQKEAQACSTGGFVHDMEDGVTDASLNSEFEASLQTQKSVVGRILMKVGGYCSGGKGEPATAYKAAARTNLMKISIAWSKIGSFTKATWHKAVASVLGSDAAADEFINDCALAEIPAA
jgi:hypothetical protein